MKKKTIFFLSSLVVTGSSLFGVTKSTNKQGSGQLGQMQNQGQMMNQPDCSKLTVDEQGFANQLNDMNNKSMFCTQFTLLQRQQAMQMMGQMDASGNIMTADQAVIQTMQNNGMSPASTPKGRPSGCPVK